MKCPSCQTENPNLALKCKSCGAAMRKQAPPPTPVAKPKPKADDPIAALAREAVEAQKAKQGPAKKGTGDLQGSKGGAMPTKPRSPSGKLPPLPDGEMPGEGEAEAFVSAPPKPKPNPMVTVVGGLAIALGLAVGSQSTYAQIRLTTWAVNAAVRDMPMEADEAESYRAGTGTFRVPEGGVPAGDLDKDEKGTLFDLTLQLALKGKRSVSFVLVGRDGKFADLKAEAKALDTAAREFLVTYGKNEYQVVRYKLPPADGTAGALQTRRLYQLRQEAEHPFTVEFRYVEDANNGLIMNKIIEKVLATYVRQGND